MTTRTENEENEGVVAETEQHRTRARKWCQQLLGPVAARFAGAPWDFVAMESFSAGLAEKEAECEHLREALREARLCAARYAVGESAALEVLAEHGYSATSAVVEPPWLRDVTDTGALVSDKGPE